MAQILGIDINDNFLNGVVVSGKGKDRRIIGRASVPLSGRDQLDPALSRLLEKLSFQGEECVFGLPLSMLSVRNLSLPFDEAKKIRQILPLELEEHLLVPVDEQIMVTVSTRSAEGMSRLFIAALEKKLLGDLLGILTGRDLAPKAVCPATLVMAEQYAARCTAVREFLFLYGDTASLSLAVCSRGEVVFMRRLAYPEQVITDRLFTLEQGRIVCADRKEAGRVMERICRDVRHSLKFLQASVGLEVFPEQVVVAGPMQTSDGFAEQVGREFDLETVSANLSGGIAVDGGAEEKAWQPALHDRPLALALAGGGKALSCNFLRDEFAVTTGFFESKKQAVAGMLVAVLLLFGAFGYQFVSYSTLKQRHDDLSARMKAVFRRSFPEVTRIVDPLLQMRARLQTAETPTVSMPLFTGEKRVLAILADISSRIPEKISLHVSRLVIDQDSVRIKGTTDAFNNVNTIKKLLSASPRFFEVNIVSATKSRDKNSIRFEIRIQLTEQT
jgi:general secretion pathway protein L